MSERLAQGAVLSLVVPLVGWVGYGYVQLALVRPTEPLAVPARGDLGQMERRAMQVVKEAAPSVVLVVSEARLPPAIGQGAAKFSLGSGFLWDWSGHVVTSDLVVKGAGRVRVRFAAERLRRALVLGSAPDYGVAVLRVEGENGVHKPVRFGSSKNLEVGQAVFAIGNPFGLSGSLSQGLVSALGRELHAYAGLNERGMIQTDAVINPGNTGGPLLDSSGRLVGVNVAFVSATGGARIGFAVPVDLVNRIVSSLIRADAPR